MEGLAISYALFSSVGSGSCSGFTIQTFVRVVIESCCKLRLCISCMHNGDKISLLIKNGNANEV